MGEISQHRSVMMIVAVTSRYGESFDWLLGQCQDRWGEVHLKSERFDFRETRYYEKTMGEGLAKQFFAFSPLVDPGFLPAAKIFSNQLENDYRQLGDFAVERPLNIDPGYISEAKLVLGTTKDRDHRIYLDQGIFAEVTLHYHKGKWCARPWTYPDYQRDDFQGFFTECRNDLRDQYRREKATESQEEKL